MRRLKDQLKLRLSTRCRRKTPKLKILNQKLLHLIQSLTEVEEKTTEGTEITITMKFKLVKVREVEVTEEKKEILNHFLVMMINQELIPTKSNQNPNKLQTKFRCLLKQKSFTSILM